MADKMTYCNPLDIAYRYQHMKEGAPAAHREGADPTLVYFKDIYYLFVSMSAGFWYSRNLLDWQFHADSELLIYDYAPDVRQIEEVSAPFDFWDPGLFQDDDGRVYFYWGCGNSDPIYGIEMDPDKMLPIGEKVPVISENMAELGYERPATMVKQSQRKTVLFTGISAECLILPQEKLRYRPASNPFFF